MDPLTDILALVDPMGTVASELVAGGTWLIDFPRYEGIKFLTFAGGSCFLQLGDEPPLTIEPGDCLLLASGAPFRLGSGLGGVALDAEAIYSGAAPGGQVRVNGQAGFLMGGVRFRLAPAHGHLLANVLPPIVHLRGEPDRAVLRWIVAQLQAEVRDPRPGGSLLIRDLSHMMLVQALRSHIAEGQRLTGWMAALNHPRLAKALAAVHAEPARDWTLRDLASIAGMSRTGFAVSFKAVTGQTPMGYILAWKMALAQKRLREGGERAGRVAEALGYSSEGAFVAAFRRVTGSTVRDWRRGSDGTVSRSTP